MNHMHRHDITLQSNIMDWHRVFRTVLMCMMFV